MGSRGVSASAQVGSGPGAANPSASDAHASTVDSPGVRWPASRPYCRPVPRNVLADEALAWFSSVRHPDAGGVRWPGDRVRLGRVMDPVEAGGPVRPGPADASIRTCSRPRCCHGTDSRRRAMTREPSRLGSRRRKRDSRGCRRHLGSIGSRRRRSGSRCRGRCTVPGVVGPIAVVGQTFDASGRQAIRRPAWNRALPEARLKPLAEAPVEAEPRC